MKNFLQIYLQVHPFECTDVSTLVQEKKYHLCVPKLITQKSFLPYLLKGYLCKFLQKNLFWAVWKMFRKVCMDYEVDFEA